jgi:hypothetical protein
MGFCDGVGSCPFYDCCFSSSHLVWSRTERAAVVFVRITSLLSVLEILDEYFDTSDYFLSLIVVLSPDV